MNWTLVFLLVVGFFVYDMHLERHHKQVAPEQGTELIEFIIECEEQGLEVKEIDALTVSCTPYEEPW